MSDEQKLVIDERHPNFYDPSEVLKINRQIEWAAKAAIGISIGLGLIEFPRTYGVVLLQYFYGYINWDPGTFTPVISLMIISVFIGFQIVITYFPLKTLAHILRILMEMGFRSRKAG